MENIVTERRQWFRPEIVLAFVAAAAGVGGAVLGARYLSTRAATAEAEIAKRFEMTKVVVASQDVARGDLLDATNLALRSVPKRFLPPDTLDAENAPTVVGARAAIGIRKGTPIVEAAVMSVTGPIHLSSVLAPNERALTVAVDDLSSQAGALRAGDRVDLYYGWRESGDALLLPLLQRIEILSVGDSFARRDDGDAVSRGFSTVTLRLRSEDAPRVLLAQQAGDLSLLLRPPGDTSAERAFVRSSRELSRGEGSRVGLSPGVEILTGGAGKMVPDRTWLRIGTSFRGSST